ncbi:hypothetical protein HUS23_11720 [Ectothiorhodospiraceae bacterium 2226]|nr:hypothetical protein HUS23_11720 [Ectothiorhodospiraceae bacterium 2226]
MKGTPTQNALAVLLTLALLGAIGIRATAGNTASTLQGPELLAAADGLLCTVLGDTLHCADEQGQSVHEVALTSLGIRGITADLQVLAGGEVLIGDAADKRILRCDPARGACATLFEADDSTFVGTFKFHLDEASGRLFIADTRSHRLLLHTPEGGTQHLQAPVVLEYPNRIALTADERLLVANTRRQRLDVFSLTEQELIHERRYLSAGAGRRPTTFAVGPADRLWILHADGWLNDGELRVHDSPEDPPIPVALPATANLSAVVRFGERMIVADRAGIALYAIDPDALTAAPFGNGAFAEALAERAEQRAAALRRGDHAFIAALVLGFTVLGIGVLIVRADARGTTSPTGRTSPTTHFAPADRYPLVRWIEPDAAAMQRLERMLKLGALLQGVGLIGIVIATLLLFRLSAPVDPDILWRLGLLLGGLMLATPLLLGPMRQALRNRIGRRGSLMYLRDHRGQVLQIPPEESLHDKRLITYGPVAVLLRSGYGTPFYTPETFERDIRPLLARSRPVGPINLMIYQLMHRNPLAVAGALLILALMTILVVVAL